MDASSFIFALRRFFFIQGPAWRLRHDHGCNFGAKEQMLGAKTELDEALTQMSHPAVERYLSVNRCPKLTQ